MNPREYEQHQLALIAQDYKQRGFQVELEGRIPEAPGWRFDALARNDAGETIIIELVSKRRSFQDAQERLKALEAVAGKRPDLKVDFRYVDDDTGAVWVLRNKQQAGAGPNLQQALAVRLPRPANGAVDVTPRFLALWLLHVALIRAYGEHVGLVEIRTEGVLEIYNQLLRAQSLVAPEVVEDEITQGLFELYAMARGALQGGSVGLEAYEQLRLHFMNVKQQARRHLAGRARR